MENSNQLTQEDELRFKFLAEYSNYLKNMSLSDLKFIDKHNVFTLAQAKYCLGKEQGE